MWDKGEERRGRGVGWLCGRKERGGRRKEEWIVRRDGGGGERVCPMPPTPHVCFWSVLTLHGGQNRPMPYGRAFLGSVWQRGPMGTPLSSLPIFYFQSSLHSCTSTSPAPTPRYHRSLSPPARSWGCTQEDRGEGGREERKGCRMVVWEEGTWRPEEGGGDR